MREGHSSGMRGASIFISEAGQIFRLVPQNKPHGRIRQKAELTSSVCRSQENMRLRRGW